MVTTGVEEMQLGQKEAVGTRGTRVDTAETKVLESNVIVRNEATEVVYMLKMIMRRKSQKYGSQRLLSALPGSRGEWPALYICRCICMYIRI